MSRNLKWPEARALALTGKRVRLATWEKWLFKTPGWWRMTGEGASSHLVQASEFTTEEFDSDQWTDEEIKPEDVCARPAATKPSFRPAGLTIDASYTAGTLTVSGGIQVRSSGVYNLIIIVNGVEMASTRVTGTASLTKTFSMLWQPRFVVTLRAQSALPLEPWTGEVRSEVLVPPTVCLMMPVGDVVVEITGAKFAQYVAGGTWEMEVDESYHESDSSGNSSVGGGDGTGSNAASGCDGTVTANTDSANNVNGSIETYSNSYTLDVSFGYSGGKFYMGVTISGGFKTGGSDTGYGTASATVDGISIPMVSAWGPDWAGNPGYVNTSHVSIVASFTP